VFFTSALERRAGWDIRAANSSHWTCFDLEQRTVCGWLIPTNWKVTALRWQ